MKSTVWTKTYEKRRNFVGGSDTRIIMGSDEAALHRLWREKRGEAEPQDLSDNLIVQLGSVTEDLNRTWYERNTGRQVREVQRHVRHALLGWMGATLDGIVARRASRLGYFKFRASLCGMAITAWDGAKPSRCRNGMMSSTWRQVLRALPSLTPLTKSMRGLRIHPKAWPIVSCESADSDPAPLNCSIGTKRLFGDKSRSLSFCCSRQSDARASKIWFRCNQMASFRKNDVPR